MPLFFLEAPPPPAPAPGRLPAQLAAFSRNSRSFSPECAGALPVRHLPSATLEIGQSHGCSVAGRPAASSPPARSSKVAPARSIAVSASGP